MKQDLNVATLCLRDCSSVEVGNYPDIPLGNVPLGHVDLALERSAPPLLESSFPLANEDAAHVVCLRDAGLPLRDVSIANV